MPEHQPSALRILLACARPLILKTELWEAQLNDTAAKHREVAVAALAGSADLGRVWAGGHTLRFELFPPRPPSETLQEKLAAAVPLTGLGVTPRVTRLDVHRPGEELEALREALQGLSGVEVHVHPAATYGDLLAFLRENEIDVLQFAGHGDALGGLYFEDGRGGARRVTPNELARLLQGRVKVLVAGACHSERAVSTIVHSRTDDGASLLAAIVVDGDYPIHSRAVQIFASAFYASLARGRDVGAGFTSGVEAVRTDDLVGERSLPDAADRGMPTPWRSFRLLGNGKTSWPPHRGGASRLTYLLDATPHRKLPRADELFVGRNIEIAATVEALDPPRGGIAEHKPRVVTLHGEGGIGKTRLAGGVAEWLAERGRFPGGIVEVDCERAANAVELAIAILGALRVDRAESVPDPPAALVELLGTDSPPRLLVLDNVESLFGPGAPGQPGPADASPPLHPGALLKQCLTASPALRILATCRWPLQVGSDENPFEVDPLSEDEAEELFILSVHHQDIRQTLLALVLDERASRLAAILRATERMPLALVLAARRLTDPGQDLGTMLERASQDLLTLCQDERLSHLPPRLRSVRASLQLSYEPLSEPAKTLFARMSFFPGGLYRAFEPMARVLGEGWQQLLADEVAYFALARYDRDRDLFALLNPVRAFALERLDAGEGDVFRRRVIEFWTDAARAYGHLLKPSQLGSGVLEALELPDDPEARREALDQHRLQAFSLLASQEDNITAAAAWVLLTDEESGDELVDVFYPYLDLSASWRTQEQLCDLAASRAERVGQEAKTLGWQGQRAVALSKLHQWHEAKALYEGVLAGYRGLAQVDPDAYLPNVAMTLNNLGTLLKNLGEREAARRHYEEALDLRRRLAERYPDAYLPDVAMTLNNLGALLAGLGEREAARRHYKEALAIYWPLFEQLPRAFLRNVLIVLDGLARVYSELGLHEKAEGTRKLIERLLGKGGDEKQEQ